MVRNVIVSAGFDAADDWIAERAGDGDIVITADVPLAGRCVAAGAQVTGPTGRDLRQEQYRHGDSDARPWRSICARPAKARATTPPSRRATARLFSKRSTGFAAASNSASTNAAAGEQCMSTPWTGRSPIAAMRPFYAGGICAVITAVLCLFVAPKFAVEPVGRRLLFRLSVADRPSYAEIDGSLSETQRSGDRRACGRSFLPSRLLPWAFPSFHCSRRSTPAARRRLSNWCWLSRPSRSAG